ncbi:MAG: MoxR family ATPase [Bradymonadaceae bacterium]|nr:MoxR family ATPase [Lujinxingiaceae bacterium]
MSDVPAALPEASNSERLEHYRSRLQEVKMEIGRIFIGPERVVESLLIALFARGHILLEGVPGVAKTTLVRTFAQSIAADFRRIQFTPDLLPSDITGTYIPNLQTNDFVLRKGPIFSSIVLGDEINRAPAKTQSALLEAMQERQVTIEGITHKLEEPFLVLATQNPIEHEGVYALPEAQLDRFLLKITVHYPTFEQELRVLKTHQHQTRPAPALLTAADIAAIRDLVEAAHLSEEILNYIINLIRFTREHAQVALGASPRAGLALLKASQARAVIHGRDFVLPDDVRMLAPAVLAHRVLLHPEAEMGGVQASEIVCQAIERVRYA